MTNWAITIGINRYENLRQLDYAQYDAEKMASLLKEELGFKRVFLFTDTSPAISSSPTNISTRPTFAILRRFLSRQFGRPRDGEKPLLKTGDNLWLFFAGHGQRHRNIDYLMLSDSDPDDPESTALSVDFITQQLQNCGADNIVLFLDACRDEGTSGGGGRGIGVNSYPGVIIFYSCQPTEQSWEIGAPVNQGSFTHVLMRALRGETGGHCATVQQVDEYLREQVPQLNNENSRRVQTPALAVNPADKRNLILLTWFATTEDVLSLKLSAYRAESEQNWELAWQLWIRVNGATSGQDPDFIDAINRLRNRAPGQQPLTEQELEAVLTEQHSSTLLESDQEQQSTENQNPSSSITTNTQSRTSSEDQSSNNLIRRANSLVREYPKLFVLGVLLCVVALISAVLIVQKLLTPNNPSLPSGISNVQWTAPKPLESQISFGEYNFFPKESSNEKSQNLKAAGIQAMQIKDYPRAAAAFEDARRYNPNNPDGKDIEVLNSPETLIYYWNAKIGTAGAYTIAIVIPDGRMSPQALEMLRGFAQAQNEFNSAGGIKGKLLKLAIVNDKDDGETANRLAELIVKKPEILAVAGHWTSDVSIGAAQVYSDKQYKDQRIVFVAPVSASQQLTDSTGFSGYVYRTNINTKTGGQALAKYMLNVWNSRKVAIFYADVTYSSELTRAFGDAIKGEAQSILFNLNDNNFNAEQNVEQAINEGAEAILLATDPLSVQKTWEVIKANQGRKKLLGDLANLYSSDTLDRCKKGIPVSGMVMAVSWRRDNNSGFVDRAEETWGVKGVNHITATSFDALQTLIEAIRRSPSNAPTRSSIKEALQSEDFSAVGATGRIQFTKGERNLAPQLVEVQKNNGTCTFVQPNSFDTNR